jgi:CyaY protein
VDESQYEKTIAATFRRVEDALADVDPDVVEVNSTGDMVTLQFKSGVKCILNTQRAVHQLWMAARATAWHFSWDEGKKEWQDDKGRGGLWETLTVVVNDLAGQDVLK